MHQPIFMVSKISSTLFIACQSLKMLPIAFLFVILSVCFADDGLTRCDPPSGQPNCVCHRKYGVVDLTKIALNDGNPR